MENVINVSSVRRLRLFTETKNSGMARKVNSCIGFMEFEKLLYIQDFARHSETL